MSETIVYPLPSGANYVIPDIGDENWGQNVTNFLVAIPAGTVPTSGNFALTGDVSFTGGFGLVSPYFKTPVVNPASAGFLRLAKTGTAHQVIASASTGAVTLSTPQSIDTTSSPTFASLTLSAPLTVPNGGTGDASFAAYSVLCGGTTSTAALQNVSGVGSAGQFLQSNGAGTLPTWANASGSGTVNSGTAGNFAYYAASTNAVSDSGVSSTSPSFTGITIGGGDLTATAASNQLKFTGNGGGNQIRTMNIAATTTVGEVITLPDSGGSDTFALLGATQTFTATTTLNSGKLGGNLNANSNKITSLAAPSTTGDALSQGNAISATTGTFSGIVQVPNGTAGAPGLHPANDATTGLYSTIAGNLLVTASGALIAGCASTTALAGNGAWISHGTTTNDNALAGFVGEYVVSTSGTVNITNGQFTNITSINLTAGDWDVSGFIEFVPNTGTGITLSTGVISLFSGNTSTDHVESLNLIIATGSTLVWGYSQTYRVSTATTPTVYLKSRIDFSGGQPQTIGTIRARRVR